MTTQPAGAGNPAITCGVLQNATIWLPGFAGIVRAEEKPRIRSEVQRPGLLGKARLDVPGRVHRQPRPPGQADLLRARPRLATVGRPLDRRTIDDMVRRRVERAVARIDRRVVHAPAVEQWAPHLPLTAIIIGFENEEPLARACQGQDADSHEPNPPGNSCTMTPPRHPPTTGTIAGGRLRPWLRGASHTLPSSPPRRRANSPREPTYPWPVTIAISR